MKRIATGLGLFCLAAFLFYKASFVLSERMVRGQSEAPALAVESSTTELERLVVETLVPAVLKDATLLEDATEIREDDMGEWNSVRMSWQLPEGEDPDRSASRLMALAQEMAPQAKVYRSQQEALVESLRIYVGKRLTHHIQLTPTLSQQLPPRRNTPTDLAVVVLGLGQNGQETKIVLERRFPLTVAIEPYSPFALRQARDAILKHKEVLSYFEEPLRTEEDLIRGLAAVPNATGIALHAPPQALPLKKLVDDNLYVLDSRGDIESDALRRATNSGVSVLKLDHAFQAGDLLKIQHIARVSTGLIVTVSVDEKEELEELLSWVETDAGREIRPVFLSELLAP